ncbi:MAG: hypothetical protein CL627_17515 [Aurantimonas sp.]|nr:hypothetical protein [Aurantimonas sp.]
MMSPSVISALKYEEHIMVGIVLGIWEATGQLSDIVENGNRAINLCAILRIGSNLIASRAFLPADHPISRRQFGTSFK